MRPYKPDPVVELYRQLVIDLNRQWELIKRLATGDHSVKQEINELEGAIQVKSLVARAARKQEEK